MSTDLLWARIRPGLYEQHGRLGRLATVERGAETGRWYADCVGSTGRCSSFHTLREAKRWADGQAE